MLKKKQKNKDVLTLSLTILQYTVILVTDAYPAAHPLKLSLKTKNLFSFAVVLWELMPRINENYVLIKKKTR